MGTVTHTKVSTKPDKPDVGDVRPSDWNATHTLVGTFPPDAHTHPPADIIPQGAGSGLDADLVDGLHASDLMTYAKVFRASMVAA